MCYAAGGQTLGSIAQSYAIDRNLIPRLLCPLARRRADPDELMRPFTVLKFEDDDFRSSEPMKTCVRQRNRNVVGSSSSWRTSR